MTTPPKPSFSEVLAKAAELQRIVPGAVLVGGSAAAFHAGHRHSIDHAHVITDLDDRFDSILDHLEALGDWSLARAQRGKIILGSLGGIETGIRQLIRRRPLETEEINVDGELLVVPTAIEILRIKAWLALTRNQTRDYLDVAALTDHIGLEPAAQALRAIGDYYDDLNERPEAVASQLVRQLADPQPRDARTTDELASYKGLDDRWHDCAVVRRVLADLARAVVG